MNIDYHEQPEMGSIEIGLPMIRIVQYFCIGFDLVFHHSIAYRYQLSVFMCIADTSILILFVSTNNLASC